MTQLQASIVTALSIDKAFDYVADFANSQSWDPGVASAVRIDGDAPGAGVPGAAALAIGARFELGVRMRGRIVPMEYRITAFERPSRVTLAGNGSNVTAVDDIRFAALDGGTRVDYTADIHLGGWMRLVEPFAGGAFRKLAADALDGMQRTLDEQARSTPATASDLGPDDDTGLPA